MHVYSPLIGSKKDVDAAIAAVDVSTNAAAPLMKINQKLIIDQLK